MGDINIYCKNLIDYLNNDSKTENKGNLASNFQNCIFGLTESKQNTDEIGLFKEPDLNNIDKLNDEAMNTLEQVSAEIEAENKEVNNEKTAIEQSSTPNSQEITKTVIDAFKAGAKAGAEQNLEANTPKVSNTVIDAFKAGAKAGITQEMAVNEVAPKSELEKTAEVLNKINVTETNALDEVKRLPDIVQKKIPHAPSPKLVIAGEEKLATFVVDLSDNKLFRYDDKGQAFEEHSVASGAAKTPTGTGIRKITHVEKYPYDKAPKASKRRKNPKDYGPYIILLTSIDPKTGKNLGSNGEFIHGTRNEKSIGKHVSHGCVRMYNATITRLANEVQSGSYVLIQE